MSSILFDSWKRMQFIRQTELLLADKYPSNLIKTPLHLANGAEAIPCGVLPFFSKPRIFGTYRSHHWYLEVTQSPETLFLEVLGKDDSPARGRAGSMHLNYPENGMILTSAVVSSTIPIAVGDAWANSAHGSQTIVSFGDGATEEGVFFESLNFAALKKIPLLFVCEDNDLAIHSKRSSRQSFSLKKLSEACGVPYFFGKACDIRNVTELMPAVVEALKDGPVLLHLEYFRLLSHVGVEADYDQGYRSKPLNESDHDPLWNCKEQLLKDGISEAELQRTQEAIHHELTVLYAKCLSKADADPKTAAQFIFKGGAWN